MNPLRDFSPATIEAAIRAAGCQQIDWWPVPGVFGDDDAILPRGMGWGIAQNPKEAAVALAAWHALGVRSALEIGTYTGGFARFMGEAMGWDVTSIDVTRPPIEPVGYRFVHEHSTAFEPSRRFDLIFIDGDHHYEPVAMDYLRFAPLADKVVALHDIAGNHECEGVARFFSEAQAIFPGRWRSVVSDDWPLGIGWEEVESNPLKATG